MTNLKEYLQDGANYQAKAVLAFLQRMSIEESWNDERKEYDAEPKVARWENCREQGYIVSLRSKNRGQQLNIAFFEHRNSDSICAIKWEQISMNSITIDTAQFNGQCYNSKWDVSKSVSYGQAKELADWIEAELTEFWIETASKESKTQMVEQ